MSYFMGVSDYFLDYFSTRKSSSRIRIHPNLIRIMYTLYQTIPEWKMLDLWRSRQKTFTWTRLQCLAALTIWSVTLLQAPPKRITWMLNCGSPQLQCFRQLQNLVSCASCFTGKLHQHSSRSAIKVIWNLNKMKYYCSAFPEIQINWS